MNISLIKSTCAYWANRTLVSTSAWITSDGVVRYQHADFPIQGKKVCTFEPEEAPK